MSKGHLIVIVAPSGTGKSTLINRLKEAIPELKWSVSCTTRSQRPGEADGQNYYFLSKDDFEMRIQNNDFVEYATVHSNYYGTSKTFTDEGLAKGEYLLFDLDVQGCDSMKEIYKDDASVIFIEPPSFDALEQRLRGRGTENDEVIRERLQNAKKELLKKNDYDYLVMNDELDRAFNELKNIVVQLLKK